MPLDEPLLKPKGRVRAYWRDWQHYAQRHRFRWLQVLRQALVAGFVPTPSAWPRTWYLWVPSLLILGVASYFALPVEPPVWAGSLALILCCFVITAVWRGEGINRVVRIAAVVMAVTLVGFSTGQWRTAGVTAPVLAFETRAVMVEGTVSSVEHRQRNRLRLTIDAPRLSGSDEALTTLDLARLRLTMPRPNEARMPTPGDQVAIRAILRPPPTPSYPDGYHFGRDLFFKQVGAVGYSIGPLSYRDTGQQAGGFNWRQVVETTRLNVAQRINSSLDGEAAGVAIALMTGQRGGIGDDTYDAIRQAGIAHLLAISGLHLGIVAGWIFVAMRLLLAVIPGIALRYPVKKYSAAFALVGAAAYVLLAGAPIPTIRAFIMVALGIGALWLDRDPFSLRLVGVAGIAVILTRPEAVIGPSFQMSFAAVTALIVTYQAFRDRGWFAYRRDPGRWLVAERAGRFLTGLTITTIVASAATAPFAIYHFQQVATFGLVGNLVGVPLATLWIIPSGMIGLLAMPLGLETLPIQIMGYGIDLVLMMAMDIAAMEWASVSTYAMSGLIVLGTTLLLLLTIGRIIPTGIALLALCFMLAFVPAWRVTPSFLLTADGDLLGARDPVEHTLYLNQTRRGQFTREQWQRRLAQPTVQGFDELSRGNKHLRCDGEGCLVFDQDGKAAISLAYSIAVVRQDCAHVPIIVLPAHYARQAEDCNQSRVIDRGDLRDSLGMAIYPPGDGSAWRIEQTITLIGKRPWSPMVNRD